LGSVQFKKKKELINTFIQQKCIILMTSYSKNIYDVTKDFYLK